MTDRQQLAKWLQKLAIDTPYATCPDLIDAAIKAAELLNQSPGPAKPVEIRLNDDKTLDEVVASDATFHLEQMDFNHWWMEVECGGKAVSVWLHSKGAIRATYEHRDYSPSPATARPNSEEKP